MDLGLDVSFVFDELARIKTDSVARLKITAFVVFGLAFMRPVFVIVMSSIRFRNPLRDASPLQIFMTAVALIICGFIYTGRAGPALHKIERDVVNPVRISWFQSDTCTPDERKDCVVYLVEDKEIMVNWYDRVVRERLYEDYTPDSAQPVLYQQPEASPRPKIRPLQGAIDPVELPEISGLSDVSLGY